MLVAPGNPDHMLFFSSEELIASFLTHQDFVNPKSLEKKAFTKLQIDRLEIVASDSGRDPTLYETIAQMKMSHGVNIKSMAVLAMKPDFKKCLQEILEIAMFMRGWDGKSDYPLLSKDTQRVVDQIILSERLVQLRDRLEADWLEKMATTSGLTIPIQLFMND